MIPRVPLREALSDPNLLGTAIAGDSWRSWRTLLIAAMGEVLREDEREIFSNLTGRDREPLQRVDQFAAVIGRRGGKSRAMATLACYLAGLCEHPDALVPGERGVLLCVALDQRVAKIVLDYAEASFERSPILKQLIASRTADALELTNGITLEARPASFRKLRGPTYVAVIADELAFWYVDTAYANPDVEILNAVEPGLATTGGPLILASSPHARRGVLWDVFRRHYGAGGDPLILVAHAPSRTLNPSLPQRVVDRALEKDRTRATAEYLAEFRTDVEGFVALEVVESCVGDHREMLPATGVTYRAFVDPSGGSEDAMTLAIAHGSTRPDERVIVERHRVDQPTISGRSRANLGHYKPLFACDDCIGRNVAFDNLCVIENELQAAMTNPLLRGLVDLLGARPCVLTASRRTVIMPADLPTLQRSPMPRQRLSSTEVMEYRQRSASLRLDVEGPDDLAPLFGFVGDELAKV